MLIWKLADQGDIPHIELPSFEGQRNDLLLYSTLDNMWMTEWRMGESIADIRVRRLLDGLVLSKRRVICTNKVHERKLMKDVKRYSPSTSRVQR